MGLEVFMYRIKRAVKLSSLVRLTKVPFLIGVALLAFNVPSVGQPKDKKAVMFLMRDLPLSFYVENTMRYESTPEAYLRNYK